jgi:hypothetical protein
MSYCNDIIESQSGNTDDDNISYDDIDDNVDIVELLNEYGITNNNISANNGRAIMRNIIIDHKNTLQLLSQVFPEKVVAKLRTGEQVKPQSFKNVTIFFSDIGIIILNIIIIIIIVIMITVGFTKIASEIEPESVIDLLNAIYLVMDYVASLFPIFKVETIGDAYMIGIIIIMIIIIIIIIIMIIIIIISWRSR